MSLGFVAAPPPTAAAGRLDLSVRRVGRRTVPEHASSHGVLRLMKPHYLDDSGQATYIVVNPGGAYFPESYDLRVRLRTGSALVLTTQSATRIHRTTAGPAVQNLSISLEGSARLEYLPDSLIAYADSRYRQFTELTVSPESTLFLGEIVTPGWHPEGLRFSYRDLHLRTAVSTGDSLVCVDNLRLTPQAMAGSPYDLGQLEGYSHLGSVLLLGPHLDAWFGDRVRELMAPVPGEVGVTGGERHGVSWLMVRALANSTDELRAAFADLNTLDRAATTGQGPLDLRRY